MSETVIAVSKHPARFGSSAGAGCPEETGIAPESVSEGMNMDQLVGNIVIDASELDALPGGSVIITNENDVGCVYAKWPEHHLASLYGPWYPTGYEVPCGNDDIRLPARLIWHPDWFPSG